MEYDEIKTKEKIDKFASHMLEAMRNHKHKGGWEDRAFLDMISSIGDKFVSVLKAVNAKDIPRAAENLIHLANHAMMMTDRLGYIERPLNEGSPNEPV